MTVGTNLEIHVWYDEAQKQIKMRIAGELTNVTNDPASKRGNPSLFRKLAATLRDAGKDYPKGVL